MADGLLLLHAWPLDARMWEPQLAALPVGLGIAPPNHPGFGGTEPVGRRPGRPGFDRAVVCGLSMGGYVAVELWGRSCLPTHRANTNMEAPAEFDRLVAQHLEACGVG